MIFVIKAFFTLLDCKHWKAFDTLWTVHVFISGMAELHSEECGPGLHWAHQRRKVKVTPLIRRNLLFLVFFYYYSAKMFSNVYFVTRCGCESHRCGCRLAPSLLLVTVGITVENNLMIKGILVRACLIVLFPPSSVSTTLLSFSGCGQTPGYFFVEQLSSSADWSICLPIWSAPFLWLRPSSAFLGPLLALEQSFLVRRATRRCPGYCWQTQSPCLCQVSAHLLSLIGPI